MSWQQTELQQMEMSNIPFASLMFYQEPIMRLKHLSSI
jgi:hypothetical protein